MPDRARSLVLGVACALAVAAALAAGRGWLWGGPGMAGDPATGRVTHVADGDTFRVSLPGSQETVRVIGVDTPEVAHDGRPARCFGPEAAAWARARLEGRTVRLVRGVEPVDRFGRTLARVWVVDGPLAGQDLASALARSGLARALAIEPNTVDAELLARLVGAARRARLGLWGACGVALAFPEGS